MRPWQGRAMQYFRRNPNRRIFDNNEGLSNNCRSFNVFSAETGLYSRHFITTSKRNLDVSAPNFKAGYGSFFTRYAALYQSLFKKGCDLIKCRPMSTSVAMSATKAHGSVAHAVETCGLVAKGHEMKIAIWLFGCATWVFSMVILGGATRLTRSGLSMTDWKFTGKLPPLTVEEWNSEFDKYKQSPEYKRVNKGMSLDEFKFIYWMEYAHRMWGRALGIVFTGPFFYFISKGYITRQLSLRLSALFAMGAAQGLIGWWMVKSGLQEPESEYVEPRVSPYRLATHLTSAFVIYCGLLWTGLSVAMPEPPTESVEWVKGASSIRRIALPVSAIVALTAISGAFVAGNDAGRAFNTFPKMGDNWIPDGLFDMKPFIRNFFENTATVQFDHRILAATTLVSICGMWLATRNIQMHPAVKVIINSTVGIAALQVSLGISTLLHYVPPHLGTAHQAGALTLFTLMILLVHATRSPSPAFLKNLSKQVSRLP